MEEWCEEPHKWYEEPNIFIQAEPGSISCAVVKFHVNDKVIRFRRIFGTYGATSWMPTDDEEFTCYFHSLAYPLLKQARKVLSPMWVIRFDSLWGWGPELSIAHKFLVEHCLDAPTKEEFMERARGLRYDTVRTQTMFRAAADVIFEHADKITYRFFGATEMYEDDRVFDPLLFRGHRAARTIQRSARAWLAKRAKAATTIQRHFREANTNPAYAMCKRRLLTEFQGLTTTI